MYVDLNPHRAKVGKTLETLAHTGVARRVAGLAAAETEPTGAASAGVPIASAPKSRASLPPVAGHNRLSDCLPISTEQYLALAAWTAGIPIHAEPQPMAAAPQALAAKVLRTVLDCGPNDWRSQFTAIREHWRIAGGSEKEREWLERRQQRWIRSPVRKAVDEGAGTKPQTS